jgi:hypothetical protein
MVFFRLPPVITITGDDGQQITLVSPTGLSTTSNAERNRTEGDPRTIRGISIGVSRALLRAGLALFAMAMEILTDRECTEKIMTRLSQRSKPGKPTMR